MVACGGLERAEPIWVDQLKS